VQQKNRKACHNKSVIILVRRVTICSVIYKSVIQLCAIDIDFVVFIGNSLKNRLRGYPPNCHLQFQENYGENIYFTKVVNNIYIWLKQYFNERSMHSGVETIFY